MAKANAINLNLANCVGFPLASAVGNISVSSLNSGTNANLGYWNGAGVWAAPLGGSCGMASDAPGIARYNAANSITYQQTQGLPCSLTNGSITYFINTTSGRIISASSSSVMSSSTLDLGGASFPAPGFFGIIITAGSSSVTLSANQGTINAVTLSTQVISGNSRYLATNAGARVIFTCSSASVGDVIFISGYGAGGWRVNQLASQKIYIGSSSTTTGTGGSIASTNQYDSVELVCIVANLIFAVCGKPQSSGLTIV